MRFLLVGLTLLLSYGWTDFVPLRISVIRPSELGSFSAKIETHHGICVAGGDTFPTPPSERGGARGRRAFIVDEICGIEMKFGRDQRKDPRVNKLLQPGGTKLHILHVCSKLGRCADNYMQSMGKQMPEDFATYGQGMPHIRSKQDSLAKAIDNLTGIISVLDYGPRYVNFTSVRKCSKAFQRTRRIRLKEQIGERSVEEKVGFTGDFVLKTSNFVLLIENNKKLCNTNTRMMASASPCGVDGGMRPLFGVVNVCPGTRWRPFHGGVDLFRHELLHTLGFGTFLPGSASQRGPNSVTYTWSDTWDGSSSQPAKRRFLDFAAEAVKEVRAHLNCPSLTGVEADTADKIHLDEYIFGNELMTPTLSNVSNRFTFISAAILEETFLGERPWYRVNRSAIQWEHDSFWYGRGWGCTFARRSCLDFIGDRTRANKSTFPFCSENNFRSGRTEFNVIFGNKLVQKSAKCWSGPLVRGDSADNGIAAYGLSSMRDQVGSPPKWRFCPMAKVFVDDLFDLPTGAKIL